MDRSQRRIVFAIAITFCFWGAIGVLTGALLPDIMGDFDLSATQAGFLISFWSISFGAACTNCRSPKARKPNELIDVVPLGRWFPFLRCRRQRNSGQPEKRPFNPEIPD